MAEKRLKDVAEAMGVSVVTVSNALSGKKGVSPATADAILDKAVELGVDLSRYKNRQEKTYTIGMFVSSRYIHLEIPSTGRCMRRRPMPRRESTASPCWKFQGKRAQRHLFR